MTTLADISKHLSLSMATVSRALNGYPEVSEKTRQRVQQAAIDLGYTANNVAKTLATGKSNSIGIMLHSPNELVSAPTFLQELSLISHHLGDKGYDLLINASVQGDNLEALKNFVSKSATDGMIIKGPRVNDPRIQFLIESHVPFVVHGHDLSSQQYPFVDIDNSSIATKSLRYLHQLGHRRIGFINCDETFAFAKARGQGFSRALQELALDVQQCPTVLCDSSPSDGQEKAIEMLSIDNRPTAIVCSNSQIAFGVYMAAATLGLKIGDDLSVIAHDDNITHFKTQDFSPALTVTNAPLTDSSAPLADVIIRRISGDDISNLQTVFPIELIVRDSTGLAK